MSENIEQPSEGAPATLLDAFRLYYQGLESSIADITSLGSGVDLVIVARLGDDIDEFAALFNQVG